MFFREPTAYQKAEIELKNLRLKLLYETQRALEATKQIEYTNDRIHQLESMMGAGQLGQPPKAYVPGEPPPMRIRSKTNLPTVAQTDPS